jgi:hypothetical protein
MHKPRVVVVNQEGRWRIRQAGRHFSVAYASKIQALSAAIEIAEMEGRAGHGAEVMVRHEDDHFATEWVYGRNGRSGETEQPHLMPQQPK